MGFSRYKPKQAAHLAARKGSLRDCIEEAQGNAGEFLHPYDSKSIKLSRHPDSGNRQDRMQAYIDAIRSEAVQARKLAEQIDNLSQHAPTPTRKQAAMTDSTTIDKGKTAKKERRATDKPRAANTRSGFNPLHPSMELPPEQLIRLLGLESKKIRKHKRSRPVATQPAKASPDTDSGSLPPELERTTAAPADTQAPVARSTHRQREYERAKEQGASKASRHLWLPALAVGMVCGAAVSAYLFWMEPRHDVPDTPAASTGNKVKRAPVAAPTAKPVIEKTAPTSKPASTLPEKHDPAWQATIETREKTLRNEARQRFEKRLKQAEQVPQRRTRPTEQAVAPPQDNAAGAEMPAVQDLPLAPLPAGTSQPETLEPGLSEGTTTPATAADTETAANSKIPVQEADNSMDSMTPEPVNSFHAPETTPVEGGNPGELHNQAQDPGATTDTFVQPAIDNTGTASSETDIPVSENPGELF